MMEIGIGGTDALDWDIFLRGHGRRQMSKSEEVAAKINCSCDSQNTTRPAETKSKDFPFCRYFRKKAFNPWISHPNENKKVYDFLQVGEGLLIIFLACSNFWKKETFFYSNYVEAKKTLRIIILNDFELFRGGLPSQKLPLRSQLSFCSFSLPDKSLTATYFLLSISIIFGCQTTSKSQIQ